MSMNVGNASGEGEVMVEMNTTPLIDVMLVLLTLLIITLPIQTHAVKLDMPAPNQPPPTVIPEIGGAGRGLRRHHHLERRQRWTAPTLDSYFENAAAQGPAAGNPSQSQPARQI